MIEAQSQDVADATEPEQIDARMTAHRREAKYLVSAEQARSLARELDARLESHRHRGDGANALPAAHHYVTTIYFDTASRALWRAAHASAERHVRLRAKEYYDLHPGLTETATDPRQLVRFQPVLWLEIKRREGAHTSKQRIGIPKQDVAGFFGRGKITEEMVAIQETSHGPAARKVLDAVGLLCAGYDEELRADCLVNYRRTAWQDGAGLIRVTIDTGLGFFAPPSDLWNRDWALVRPTLGAPIATEQRRVLELKTRGELPPWLDELLRAHAMTPAPFSKFEAASSAVHG